MVPLTNAWHPATFIARTEVATSTYAASRTVRRFPPRNAGASLKEVGWRHEPHQFVQISPAQCGGLIEGHGNTSRSLRSR